MKKCRNVESSYPENGSLSGSHLQPVFALVLYNYVSSYVVQQQVYFPGLGEGEVPLL